MAQSAQKITPASEFCRNFGRYKDEAISKGAVEVSSNGRPVGAYLSQSEYEHFLVLKRRETQVHTIDNLPQGILEDIENAKFGIIAE